MTKQAVQAVQHEVTAVVALVEQWSAAQWTTASRAIGWSSKDVVCHLAAVFQQLCDPDGVPTDPSLGEHSVDLAVEARRHLAPHEVLDDYARWSEAALATLSSMQDGDDAEQIVPMSILGSHPLHLLANAYAFDHHCHVRHDLDLDSGSHWPAGTNPRDLTDATVDWMMAAAPQMCGDKLGRLSGPIDLHVDERTWTITSPPGRAIEIRAVNSDGHARSEGRGVIASISLSGDDFVLWGTQRVPAVELDIEIDGDRRIAEFLVSNFKIY